MSAVSNPKPSKYRNRKTVVDGVTFDSAAEAKRYGELRLLERAGQITGLELQPSFPLIVNNLKVCTYRADFTYQDAAKNRVVEDCKGFLTPTYRLKKKLMLAVHGVEIFET
jgi:hypothetical protein